MTAVAVPPFAANPLGIVIAVADSSEEHTMDFKGLANKALGLARKNAGKVDPLIEKVGDAVDKKTGGKYAAQVDKAQDAARKAVRDQQK
ncbi:antitoxin [Nocardia carnea]|uniref:antitoxin n=1 Tax=Nocardia carnea TaxID=37328 RepID=UPI002457285E|nr:antitoxin [Nocardia carnea]